MKRVGWFVASLALIYCLYKALFPTYAYQFRVTLSVNTPSGMREGSGIMEARSVRYPGGAGYSVYGDAVLVELGASSDGRPHRLIALLATGPQGENVDFYSLPIRAFEQRWSAKPGSSKFAGADLQMSMMPVGAKETVPADHWPKLVTFENWSDPKSAQLVTADNIHQVFGPHFDLNGLTIEIVRQYKWPETFFNSGEITRGIKEKLPWWHNPGRPAADALISAGLLTAWRTDAVNAFTR